MQCWKLAYQSNTELQTVQILMRWLIWVPSHLDLHCLQRCLFWFTGLILLNYKQTCCKRTRPSNFSDPNGLGLGVATAQNLCIRLSFTWHIPYTAGSTNKQYTLSKLLSLFYISSTCYHEQGNEMFKWQTSDNLQILYSMFVCYSLNNTIALVKVLFSIQKYWYFSYFSKKTYIVVLIRSASQGSSNEYSQHMFSWRNKKNINPIPTLI